MIDALARWLSTRPARERGLLAILVFLALPAGFVALVALPMLDARDAARADHARAQALADWYAQTRAVIETLPAPTQTAAAADAAPVPALGLSALEALLAQAALDHAVVSLAADGPRDRVLSLIDAPFDLVIEWLDTLPGAASYHATTVQITPADAPGLVNADLRLSPLR